MGKPQPRTYIRRTKSCGAQKKHFTTSILSFDRACFLAHSVPLNTGFECRLFLLFPAQSRNISARMRIEASHTKQFHFLFDGWASHLYCVSHAKTYLSAIKCSKYNGPECVYVSASSFLFFSSLFVYCPSSDAPRAILSMVCRKIHVACLRVRHCSAPILVLPPLQRAQRPAVVLPLYWLSPVARVRQIFWTHAHRYGTKSGWMAASKLDGPKKMEIELARMCLAHADGIVCVRSFSSAMWMDEADRNNMQHFNIQNT